MRSYTADPAAARQANQNNYVDQSGKYIGEFTLAEAVTSRQGTDGIEFSFKTREGQQANYLTLWTHNAKGEALYGYKVLSAIMTVTGVQALEPKQGNIKGPDGNSRQVTAFPALHGKPVGLVLQKVLYTKSDGKDGYKFNIFAPFNALSELTAKEILDGNTQPKALGGIVATLKDKDERTAGHPGAGQASANGAPDDPFGDDLGQGF
ncbi:hypothetical protein [Castellaniella sp.]|uniref:hypothetical protein n=1 Tax=Castellaniella sp. TaxID=1955812 RepID=UPI002AFF591E|nr:hypothetical protein [Castellaniella sp.]